MRTCGDGKKAFQTKKEMPTPHTHARAPLPLSQSSHTLFTRGVTVCCPRIYAQCRNTNDDGGSGGSGVQFKDGHEVRLVALGQTWGVINTWPHKNHFVHLTVLVATLDQIAVLINVQVGSTWPKNLYTP